MMYCYGQLSDNTEAKVISWLVWPQDFVGHFCPGILAGIERLEEILSLESLFDI